jgi:hypothetical protein
MSAPRLPLCRDVETDLLHGFDVLRWGSGVPWESDVLLQFAVVLSFEGMSK